MKNLAKKNRPQRLCIMTTANISSLEFINTSALSDTTVPTNIMIVANPGQDFVSDIRYEAF
ncbi:hypothetical protein [Pectinatus frisingensis]|uniref:hypothetical protein n=1 Tax=Pectinatus frisingensis TaxID=865 RepID=UPI003D801204